METTPLTITGVQLALLTAKSIPNKLNDSELFAACIPKNTSPIIPIKVKMIPNTFIIIILKFLLYNVMENYAIIIFNS